MKTKKIKFQSSNGIDNLSGKIFYNEKTYPFNGLIQIVHGMWEHTDRYRDFAEYFVNNGYVVAIHNHLGHGSATDEVENLGYFGEKDGNKYIIKDTYNFSKIIKQLYPELPYFLYAHSMGGLIAINLLSVYKLDLQGLVLLGSHLNQPSNYLFYPVVKIRSRFVSPTRPAKTFTNIQNLMFSAKFRTSPEGKNWVTRKSDYVINANFNDPSPYYFSYSAYQDLFKLSLKATPKNLARNLDKNTPILLMTGSDDPVTNFTKSTRKKYDYLLDNGFSDVSYSEYKNARHNLINEPNREEVLYDILLFLDKTLNVYNMPF